MDRLVIDKIANGYTTDVSWYLVDKRHTVYHKDIEALCKHLSITFGKVEKEDKK